MKEQLLSLIETADSSELEILLAYTRLLLRKPDSEVKTVPAIIQQMSHYNTGGGHGLL